MGKNLRMRIDVRGECGYEHEDEHKHNHAHEDKLEHAHAW